MAVAASPDRLPPLYSVVPKRRRDTDDLYCSACGRHLPRPSVVRYSAISGQPYCDTHGKTVQRHIRRLVLADDALHAAVVQFGPSLLSYLSLTKIRHILTRRKDDQTKDTTEEEDSMTTASS
jgi:hypothetical protein